MKPVKKLGIWMDHSIAYLVEFSVDPFEIKTIESQFGYQKKREALIKSESLMHHKEQQKHTNYYKKLTNVIKEYKCVLLFGPTDAKVELFDILSDDARFANKKIEIKETDKMSTMEKSAFVNDYFSQA